MKDKITISISSDILKQIDDKIDNNLLKNRSNVIENLLRKWLNLKEDVWALILAHDCNWEDSIFPLNIPKVLIKIDWKTLLEKHLENLKKANIKDVIISVWDKKEQIIDFIKSKNFNLNIIFLEVLKTDLSLKVISEAKSLLSTNKMLIILWDNYFYPLNLTDFIYYHNSNNSEFSIIVKNVDLWSSYWNIKIQWNDIVEFNEKPKDKEKTSNLINTWIYLIDINSIPDTWQNLKIESDFFPNYVKNKKVKAYFHNWKWFHMQSNKILNLFK